MTKFLRLYAGVVLILSGLGVLAAVRGFMSGGLENIPGWATATALALDFLVAPLLLLGGVWLCVSTIKDLSR